jgi:hypothetical protein
MSPIQRAFTYCIQISIRVSSVETMPKTCDTVDNYRFDSVKNYVVHIFAIAVFHVPRSYPRPPNQPAPVDIARTNSSPLAPTPPPLIPPCYCPSLPSTATISPADGVLVAVGCCVTIGIGLPEGGFGMGVSDFARTCGPSSMSSSSSKAESDLSSASPLLLLHPAIQAKRHIGRGRESGERCVGASTPL